MISFVMWGPSDQGIRISEIGGYVEAVFLCKRGALGQGYLRSLVIKGDQSNLRDQEASLIPFRCVGWITSEAGSGTISEVMFATGSGIGVF